MIYYMTLYLIKLSMTIINRYLLIINPKYANIFTK